jgi:exodeoxyribonuclease VII large subunit
MASELILSVSDFVAVFNQTLEYAYPLVAVQGELASFRVSKGRGVYFDLKDELASVKFFGTVYNLSGPLEDGMLLQVSGAPRLHPLYGFSINIQHIQPVGEGSLKRAAALLEAKLRAEGLFDESRKRSLPYPPRRVGLIASSESAAYHDFVKVLQARWGGIQIELADVQVQGDLAPGQLTAALEYFNLHEQPVDALVMTRGGGSAEDLAAFSTEQVTRAVAASRIPILVAIGHEVDFSLAELAADQRASTPSNAAELLVPDRRMELRKLATYRTTLYESVRQAQKARVQKHQEVVSHLTQSIDRRLERQASDVARRIEFLHALSPQAILSRGYAVVHARGQVLRSSKAVPAGDTLQIQMSDGDIVAEVQ